MDDQKLQSIALKISSGGIKKTAGKIEFIRDQGPLRRDIRAPGFKWSPDSMKDLAKVLWAVQRSHSFAMSAYRIFSKINSSEFSPDGLLGGRGYIQSIKELRQSLSNSVEFLSSFSDTIHDELGASHWNNKSDPETDSLIDDVEEIRSNPDTFIENQYSDVEEDNYNIPDELDESDDPIHNPDPEDMNPDYESDDPDEFSQSQVAARLESRLQDLPDYGKSDANVPSGDIQDRPSLTGKKAFLRDDGLYTDAVKKAVKKPFIRREASSSLPVETLPCARVDHIGPGEGNEAGHFSDEDVWPSDDPTGEGLSSGVQDSIYLYEGADADGVSQYTDATKGDKSVIGSDEGEYSWLPGSENHRNIDFWARGLTQEDLDFLSTLVEPKDPTKVDKKNNINLNLWGL